MSLASDNTETMLPKGKQEHLIGKLDQKSMRELQELLKKQEELFAQRKLVAKLPDKRAKIEAYIAKLTVLLNEKETYDAEMDALVDALDTKLLSQDKREVGKASNGIGQFPSSVLYGRNSAFLSGVYNTNLGATERIHSNGVSHVSKKLRSDTSPQTIVTFGDKCICNPESSMELDLNTGSTQVGANLDIGSTKQAVSPATDTLNNSHERRKFKYDESLQVQWQDDGKLKHERRTQLISIDESMLLLGRSKAITQLAESQLAAEKLSQSLGVLRLNKYQPEGALGFRSNTEVISDDDDGDAGTVDDGQDEDENEKEIDYPE